MISSKLLCIVIQLNKPSKDYVLLSTLLHASAMLMVLDTSFAGWLMTLLFVLLLLFWRQSIRHSVPFPAYETLVYQQSKWLLHAVNGLHLQYEQMQIRINTPFFILLTLKTDKKNEGTIRQKIQNYFKRRKNLIIFHDQISTDDYRTLRMIELIHTSSGGEDNPI